MKPRPWLVAALAVALTACGSSSDVTAPNQVQLQHGSLSAKIDGTAWQATVGLTAVYNNGILAVGANGSGMTFGLGVAASGPGTYTIAPTSTLNAELSTDGTGQAWTAAITMGSGTLTLTSIDATGASGTFSFTMVPNSTSGASGNKSLTEGKFDLKF